ncbi:MAG: hypothetical protein KDJ25_11995 [Rhodoblastus sp.]|nr:hypothetical protein [Rhodoblastus sp.]
MTVHIMSIPAPTQGELFPQNALTTPAVVHADVIAIARTEDPQREATKFAGAAFDAQNPGAPAAREKQRLRKSDLDRDEAKIAQIQKQNLSTDPVRFVAVTNGDIKMHFANKAKILAKSIIIFCDAGATWFTASVYFSASGLLKAYSGAVTSAMVVTFLVVTAILAGQTLIASIYENRTRALCSKIALGAGLLITGLVFTAAFSIVFNPASAQTVFDADTVGAGPLVATTLDWRIAAVLVFVHLLGSILLGMGLAAQLDEDALSYAKKVAADLPEFDARETRIAQLQKRRNEAAQDMAEAEAYLVNHASLRAAFIAKFQGEVQATLQRATAKAEIARLDALQETN